MHATRFVRYCTEITSKSLIAADGATGGARTWETRITVKTQNNVGDRSIRPQRDFFYFSTIFARDFALHFGSQAYR